MSYILDALKRADAERERGHVPGLRTQPLAADDSVKNRIPAKPRLLWLGLALTALALLAAAWAWWKADTGETPAGAAPAAEIVRPEAPPAAPLPPSEPVSAAVPVAVPDAPALPILSPEPPRAKPARAPAAAAAPASGTEPVGKAETKPVPGSPATTSAAPVAATPTAAASAIRSFSDLSAEERARLPAVNVSGATYSKNPALRMLIVNGKVSLEGEEVAPGLKLETIEPRAAVLNHQGLRYRIGY
jgi:general secretion pathway protein B